MRISRFNFGRKRITGLIGSLLLTMVAGSSLLTGCVPQSEICAACDPTDSDVDADYVVIELLFENSRLTPAYGNEICGLDHRGASAGHAGALAYWLAPDEPVCAYWDTMGMVFAPPGMPTVTATCDLCDNCTDLTLSDGTEVGTFRFPGAGTPSSIAPQVRLFESQLPNLDQRSQVAAFGWRGGCASNQEVPFPHYNPSPESNVQLAVEAWPGGGNDPRGHRLAGDQAIVFAVPDAQEGFRMPLRLLEETDPFDPAAPEYHWKVEKTGQRWNEDFSTGLRISRIKVFKGRLVALETPLMDAVGQPVFFRLENAELVVPHRIEFKASQSAYDRGCYGTADTPDGDYDLGACRVDDPDGNRISLPEQATPRYGITQSPSSGMVLEETLDWIFEFRNFEGFVLPQLGPDERLAVEFTLVVP